MLIQDLVLNGLVLCVHLFGSQLCNQHFLWLLFGLSHKITNKLRSDSMDSCDFNLRQS